MEHHYKFYVYTLQTVKVDFGIYNKRNFFMSKEILANSDNDAIRQACAIVKDCR